VEKRKEGYGENETDEERISSSNLKRTATVSPLGAKKIRGRKKRRWEEKCERKGEFWEAYKGGRPVPKLFTPHSGREEESRKGTGGSWI